MAGPESPGPNPSAWWGVIQASAAAHETTAQMFDRIASEAQRMGLALPSEGAVRFNELRSQAVQLRDASDRLGLAASTDAITHDVIGPLPYARTDPAASTIPLYDVRVNYSAVQGGQELESYITLRYTGGLPPTVGDLYAEAQLATEALVEGYGAALTGLGSIQIGAL